MKIRTLIVSILGVLVISSVSLAQVAGAPEQEPQEPAFTQSDLLGLPQPEPSFVTQTAPTPTPQAPRSRRLNAKPMARTPGVRSTPPSMSTKQLRIFELKHSNADELRVMISNVFRITAEVDYRLNRLIVNATDEQMGSVASLIEAMDVAVPETSTPRDIQNLVYRIYMFEIPSGDQGMKSFSMILRTSTHVSSQELLDAAADKDLQISEFLQSNDFDMPQVEILIQGKAASNESLKRVVEKFPESHIIELKWDHETFTDNIAAAQYTQLPEPLQEHIRKFLGYDIRTVGYWFGNLSVPGEVEAPIGPWTLKLKLDTESDRMLELNVDVEMPGEMHRFDRRLGRHRNDEILSNTIRAKIGKPIIIGYNRESYGMRKMGAMVILPEVDRIQLEEN